MNNDAQNKLEKQIQCGDKFKKWGNFNSSEAKKIFITPVDAEVKILIKNIKSQVITKKHISLADVGGANGWIIRKILKNVDSKLIDTAVVDLDKSKFTDQANSKIKFVHHDARLSFKNKYDICYSRLLLHYLPKKEQKLVSKNIINSINSGGFCLIIDICPLDDSNAKIMHSVGNYMKKIRGANARHFLLKEEYKKLINTSSDIKLSFKESEIITLSANNFYRERYNLTNIEEERLNKIMGYKPAKVRMISIFVKKLNID